MGKIRVRTLGDEAQEKNQAEEARKRRETKKAAKEKAHVEGVGLKGGQKVTIVDGVELKPEVEQLLNSETKEETPKSAKKAKAARTRSHRYQDMASQIDKAKLYPLAEAIKLVIKTSTTKFDATIDAHVNINAATLPKDKPSLSGTVNLPHGTGKVRRIKIVDDKLIDEIAQGKLDFDVLVAHPSLMPKLARHARTLGPKGLMPNPKNGTVTTDPEKRAAELSGGEIQWKTEPDHPVIHQRIGKISFGEEKILENIQTLVKSIGSGKIAKLTLASSMGPGIRVNISTI